MSLTKEYAALVNCASDIENQLEVGIPFVRALYEANFISDDVLANFLAPRSMLTERGKARELVRAVTDAVKLQSKNFTKFLDILKQNEYDKVVKRLQSELEMQQLTESEYTSFFFFFFLQ